jgi:hypothetical protein
MKMKIRDFIRGAEGGTVLLAAGCRVPVRTGQTAIADSSKAQLMRGLFFRRQRMNTGGREKFCAC